MDAEVAIVGTGPGGGMAATRLATSGLKTIVLEQRSLPRPKPCGGAMPARIASVIDWDFDGLVESRVHAIRNLLDHGQDQLVDTASSILMVSRPRFDAYLIERATALAKGDIQLREQFRVTSVHEDDDGVTLRATDGASIRARYVIAADGAYSKIARTLGLNRDVKAGIAMDAEVEVDPEIFEREEPARRSTTSVCLMGMAGFSRKPTL